MQLRDLIKHLKALVPIARTIPVLGSQVEGSIEAALVVAEAAEAAKSNKEAMEDLARQVGQWASDLCTGIQDQNARGGETRLRRIEDDVAAAQKTIENISGVCKARAQATFFSRFGAATSDASKLRDLKDELVQAQLRFISNTALYMGGSIARMYNQMQHDAVYAALAPVRLAEYDALGSRTGCMPGTRTFVLAKIREWADYTSPGLSIFWLVGMAGTGKSTIAKSACEVFAGEGRLGARFFVSAQDIFRRDPHSVLRTIAYQIALKDPTAFRALYESTMEHGISSRPMAEQVQKTLFVPLTAATNNISKEMVIVIDALDECDRLGGVESGDLIPLLASKLSVFDIKLLVTSRNEHKLEIMRQGLGTVGLTLHDMDETIVDSDIRRYIESELCKVAQALKVSDPNWPSEDDVRRLVQTTGPFFIYAATVVRYIANERHDPVKRLRQLLDSPKASSNTLDAVDAVYERILDQCVRNEAGREDADLRKRIQLILGTIVVAMEPLPIRAIANMLPDDVCPKVIQMDVVSLGSILFSTADESLEPVRVLHASFPDFLRGRCADPRFHIDTSEHHERMAVQCIQILNTRLRKNICDIPDPSVPNSEVPSLVKKLTAVAPEELRYAAKHWVAHLIAVMDVCGDDSELMGYLNEFCSKHLLQWLELMSLLNELQMVHGNLLPLIVMMKGLAGLSRHRICQLLIDCKKLLSDYRIPISEHALHIYHSGLVAMPHGELLMSYDHDCRETPVMLSQRERVQSGWLKLLEGHDGAVYCVAFSPDGKSIVSSSYDQTVRVWDAASGAEKCKMTGHDDSVSSVAFSTDSKSIVSGSADQTVQVWDAATGVQKHKMAGHNGSVRSVAFSPDGKLIVSGSDNQTVRVWDTASGVEKHKMIGHDYSVRSVAFSPDSKSIVSGSADQTVRVWDAASGVEKQMMTGHSDPVHSVAFSPDGRSIVSGSRDNTVRVWDAASGVEKYKMTGHNHWVWSVAFSADSKLITSCSQDQTVRVWDAATGVEKHMMTGHDGAVYCVAFSPDGKSIVSGSYDQTVRVWDAASDVETHKIAGHDDSVSSVTFSTDGKSIVSGSSDQSVRVWDAATGVQKQKMTGHNHWVLSVAFSPDSKSIVSGSADQTMRVWDAASGVEKHKMTGHKSWVRFVAFSTDGKSIISRDGQDTPHVWDAATGTALTEVHQPQLVQALASVHHSTHHPVFELDSTGWVRRLTAGSVWQRVCWLPPHRRGYKVAAFEETVCIGASTGAITILDFSPLACVR